MATFYLLNSLYVGANFLAAGTLIDDAVDNVANIKASGGALAPSSNPVVARTCQGRLPAQFHLPICRCDPHVHRGRG